MTFSKHIFFKNFRTETNNNSKTEKKIYLLKNGNELCETRVLNNI